ncbi:MAG: serine/threonine protein kinase [Deltaproteobacteria bacterium]|nr:serine/threonine protein kinase [Deltaproteobacteria bacterium]
MAVATVGDTQPASSSTPSSARERIERHALAAEIMRVRAVLVAGWAVWAIGGGFDVLAYHLLGGGPLWLIITTRATSFAFLAALAWRLFHGGLDSPHATRALIVATFPVCALAQSILAVAVGGVTSPYIGGVYIVLICQAAAVTMRWQRGFILSTITTWMLPLGFALGYAFSPAVRVQLATPRLRDIFILEVLILFSAGAIATWASHAIWMLRQRLVESGSVGRYRLLRRLGRGGMGEVWHAHDRATRRDVALKILLHHSHGTDPDNARAAIDRFEREIETTARLDHPNVVRIIDWGATDDGIWYYAMELLDGADLATLVKTSGPLAPRTVLHLGIQAARALAAAHAAGIIHRDIKPANLFIVRGTDLKVLDFGVARVEGDNTLTRTGALIGTPAFMAPEAALGAPATTASDVWSLGASLRFAVTGALPSEPTELAPELAALLARALATDPAARFADGTALLDALASIAIAPVAPSALALPRVAIDAEAPTLAPDK